MEKACHLVPGLVKKRCEMFSSSPCGLRCYLHFNLFGGYSRPPLSSVVDRLLAKVAIRLLEVLS